MLSTLRSRLTFTYLLITAVVISVVGAALVFNLYRLPYERLRLAVRVIQERTPNLASFEPRRMQAAVERADDVLGVRVGVYDRNGALLADSRGGQGGAMPNFVPPVRLQRNRMPFYRDPGGQSWIFATTPMQGGVYLVAATPRARFSALEIFRDEFFRPFMWAILIAMALGVSLAVWIARWVSAPLQRMAQTARQVAETDLLTGAATIPLDGPKEVQVLGQAFNDMTARVGASQQAQRDFVANVSHELKTPLTSIQGFAQAILDGAAAEPDELKTAAEVIYSESGRMHRMVLDLLDLARLDAGTLQFEMQEVDLDELLKQTAKKFEPLARQAQVRLITQVDSLPPVMCDADRLAQVFGNLLDNALKHSPSGGEVVLAAGPEGEMIEISVRDSGPGIPPDELERIFERFYQTDKARSGGSRRGAGLGLAIAREIVLAHGGSIRARNREDERGSVFVVRLPV